MFTCLLTHETQDLIRDTVRAKPGEIFAYSEMAEEIQNLDAYYFPCNRVSVDEYSMTCLVGTSILYIRAEADIENIRCLVVVHPDARYGIHTISPG
jgi:hypothetical protein